MRFIILALVFTSASAANLTVDNATPVRFGANFATVDGVRIARFNGDNGIDIPLSTEDAGETEVIAVLKVNKGAKFNLKANIGRRVVQVSSVGTGELQEVMIGRLQIPAGLSRLSLNAPESRGAQVELSGLKLPGLISAVSPAILPLYTTYIDDAKGDHTSWKGIQLLAGGEARIPLVSDIDGQERVLSLHLRASGAGKLTLATPTGLVSVDVSPSITTIKTPTLKFPAGVQFLRLKTEGANVRIDEIVLDSGNVSHLWPLPNGNAQSVHFDYDEPKGVRAQWAYAEALAEPGPPTTYHCVLGFNAGYFGYQVRNLGEGEHDRLFIYSLWDNGYVRNSEKAESKESLRDKVVTLLAKGDGVTANAFDHEGSGGHSHLDFAWKDRQPYKFLLGVKPDGKAAVFSAYVSGPGLNGWKFLASFRRPNTDARLNGLYSFVEDWSGRWGDQQRACRYRNLWVCGADGKWVPILNAKATATSELGRGDYSHNLVNGMFELRTGGYDRTKGDIGKNLNVAEWGSAPQINFENLPTR